MDVSLAFGKTGLTVSLPEGFHYRILDARSARPLANPVEAVERALDQPIGAPPLAQLAAGKRTAAISVCDITRPAPNRQTLPPLLRRLERAGIPRANVTILIATGLHRPATQSEILEICGEEATATCRIVNHDARNLGSHRRLGVTASGTLVYIDERFVSADLHITLGFIEPHLMLGFSGGRKLIAPGLASRETITVLHSPRFMRDPRASEGSFEDNPLHRELLEIARMARHDFILDVVLARDRSIAAVFAGDGVEAHLRGMRFVSETISQELDAPVDAAITTSAGYPLDLTFYQCIKGVTAASHIVRPGGRILVAAACAEGAGAPEFARMLLEAGSDADFLARIESAPVTIDQWQLEKLALVARTHQVLWYVPGLPAQYHAKLWGRAYPTPETAIDALTAGLSFSANIAVIPDGPYVLARAAGAAAA